MLFMSSSTLNEQVTLAPINQMGRGGGLVVSVLAFNSDDPSLNPTGNLICMKRLK